MPSEKPVPVAIGALTAATVVAPVIVVAAAAATLFSGVDRAVTYDLATWKAAWAMAWVGLAAALVVVALALGDLRRRGVFALIALVAAGATLAGFLVQQHRFAQPTPRDIATYVQQPPAFVRLAALHPRVAGVAGAPACPAARAIPSQILASQAVSALVDAGFPIVRASTFQVEGVHQGAWFAFPHDAVVRIRPGRTDIRVAARDPRPDGGATCRLMARIVRNLEAETR